MSLQFEMDYDRGAEDRWYEDPLTGEICHDVIKVSDLFDVSVVTFPAYAETSAAMRDFSRAQARGRVPMQSKVQTGELSPRAYQRCRQVVAESAWAIHPPYLNLIMAILEERSMGYRPTDQEIKDRIGIKRDAAPLSSGSTALIPLVGPVMTRAGAMSDVSGASTLEEFKSAFRQALNDPSVQAIVLDIDSPGGTVDGVPEMAAEIAAARGIKPITAVANYMAASAAYWIATAADELVVSPSAEVGSVGVYAAHQDRSAEMASKGINTTFVYAGDHKVDGNPFQPLSEEAQAHLQEQIDSIYEDFVAAVAANRGTTAEDVLANFGQGRTMLAREAVAAGMADRVATLDEVLQEKDSPVEERSFPQHIMDESTSFSISTMPSSGTTYTSAGTGVVVTYQFETRDQVREILGFVAQAETDPVGNSDVAQAETDPVGAETSIDAPLPPLFSGNVVVEADGLAALKKRSADAAQRARDDKVRLTKEMLQ
jgi:signal peptide peptidase SppA